MKKIKFLITFLLFLTVGQVALAQNNAETFTGAKATLKSYKALYILNSADEKKISGTLRNLKNALDDPRLKGKLEVELIAFGDGFTVFQKGNNFEKILQDLKDRGVILAQCENTLRERKIEKNTLYDFINFVPSGNGEIIIRHYQGWATIHP